MGSNTSEGRKLHRHEVGAGEGRRHQAGRNRPGVAHVVHLPADAQALGRRLDPPLPRALRAARCGQDARAVLQRISGCLLGSARVLARSSVLPEPATCMRIEHFFPRFGLSVPFVACEARAHAATTRIAEYKKPLWSLERPPP